MTVVMYHTESGDRGIIGAFTRTPTDKELQAIAEEEYPEEAECGCIYFETYEVDRVQEI